MLKQQRSATHSGPRPVRARGKVPLARHHRGRKTSCELEPRAVSGCNYGLSLRSDTRRRGPSQQIPSASKCPGALISLDMSVPKHSNIPAEISVVAAENSRP